MEFYIVVCILVSLSIEINGFGNGVSISTARERLYCDRRPVDRVPFHVSDRCNGTCEAREDKPPYRIVVNNGRDDDMYWDEDVQVTIETTESSSRWRVNGFAVFALDQNEDIVGRWAESSIVQFSCGTALEGNTAVHRRGNSRRQRINLRWTPEGRNYGTITFRSTVVHSQDIYWSVKSNVSLSPEKTGEDNIDLAVEFIKLVNDSSGGTRKGLTIMDFKDSFQNRLKSGWDSRNLFGAFNRDLRVSDFFIDSSRTNGFDSAFSNRLSQISESRNSPGDSFLERLQNGGFPDMQQNMFGNQNPFAAWMGRQQQSMFPGMGGQQQSMFPGMGGQQQSMFPGMGGLQGLNNQGNQQGMFRGMPGQQGMMPGMSGQQGMMPGMLGQQGMMPGQQGMMPRMPGQQGMMPGQQGMMPGQQGMMPGLQGMMPRMPGQQGMMPGMGGQQGMMPGMQGQQGMMPGMGGQPGFPPGMMPGMGRQQQGMFPQGMRPPGVGGIPSMIQPGMGGQPGIFTGAGGLPGSSAAGPTGGGVPPPPPPFISPVG